MFDDTSFVNRKNLVEVRERMLILKVGQVRTKELQNRLAAKMPWSKNKKTRSFSHWKPS